MNTRPAGLEALEARLADELAFLQLPAPRWTPALEHAGEPVVDVAIVGAGMTGLALAASLVHRGLSVVAFDEAPAGREGPWATTARMETLRSPKQLAGPALGIPSLTFRAWFEAQFGRAAWDALDKIPRLQWMDYLRWYRAVLDLPVKNGHRVVDLRLHGDAECGAGGGVGNGNGNGNGDGGRGSDGNADSKRAEAGGGNGHGNEDDPRDLDIDGAGHPSASNLVELRVEADGGATTTTVRARRVVLATGRAGLGGPSVPTFAGALPRTRWAHSSDEHDYAALAGLRVGVVGAGASAMDSAATALEAGAAQVHLLVRRADLPRVNKGKGAGNPGFVQGYARLPDAWKWKIRRYIAAQQVPPPRNSTQRVSRFANAHFHLGVATLGAEARDGALQVRTSAGPIELDFLIFATGFAVDWRQRPMLRRLAPCICLWRDRYRPPPGDDDDELAGSPDLGAAFEFQPRPGARCPGLDRVHCLSYPATLSLGVITGDIPAISDGAQQLADALAGLLYVEDVAHHYARIEAYAEPEILGDEWVAEPLPRTRSTSTSTS